MSRRGWWVVIAGAAVALGGTVLARGRVRPVAPPPPLAPVPPPPGDRAATRTRQLVAENLDLRRQAEVLRHVLADTSSPVVRGLPVPPGDLSAEETRTMDEIGKRVTDDLRPRLAELHRELTSVEPASDVSFEAMLAGLLERAGIKDYQTFFDELSALKTIYRRNASPPVTASAALRILWLLQDADEIMEGELKEALPPDRFEQLQQQQSGFGFSITRRQGRWIVTQARPHA
jgi:hypothetical protein